MLSEFLVSISTLAQNLEDAEEVILEISQAETSSNSDVKLLDQLRQTYPYALRHPSTYKLLLQQLSHITSSWHHQGSHNPQSIDVRRITKLLEDVHFLCQYASQLEGQNDGLLEKRATLMADLRQSSSEGGENEKRRSLEQSNENSPSDAAIQGHSIHQKSGMDMGSSRNSRGQRGPSDPGSPRKSALEDYANHIQTKVDQIAYVTNILLSLSLIATIYGMNLDIFVEGGLVHVKDYLVTALPFAFGIFLVTFGLPLVSRARHVRVEVV